MSGVLNNYTRFQRRKSLEIQIGNVFMGGVHPVVPQSMANTNPSDTNACVEQAIKISEAGGKLVRFAVPTVKDAENLKTIKAELQKKGHNFPLVADVHFQPKAAEVAAELIEKVRINPGNFVSCPAGTSFEKGKKLLTDNFRKFLDLCKKNNTAVRIGVNHGSLSQRMLNKYGNTPKGMLESAMELLWVCREEKFDSVVVSMKSSNTRVMVHAYRLLADQMNCENIYYPLHLGVTEASDGQQGRIKSAVGIGSLLADGIGDTIRVSLTEDPEKEIPVANKLIDYLSDRKTQHNFPKLNALPAGYFEFKKRKSASIANIGNDNPPVVIGKSNKNSKKCPDFIFSGNKLLSDRDLSEILFYKITFSNNLERFLLKANRPGIIIAESVTKNPTGEWRHIFAELHRLNINLPVVLHKKYAENEIENLQVKTAVDFGSLFIDGMGDGIYIDNEGAIPDNQLVDISFDILQAARSRITSTEYIACPSCGRTKFDIQAALHEVKKHTVHLKGLKIAVMGCIVNGPGEMADADYGYVGAGKGKVFLYKGKTLVKKNIDEKNAISALLNLIEENKT